MIGQRTVMYKGVELSQYGEMLVIEDDRKRHSVVRTGQMIPLSK